MGRQAVLLGYDCRLFAMAAIGTMAGRLVVLNVHDMFGHNYAFLTVLLVYFWFQPADDIEEVPDFTLPHNSEEEMLEKTQ